MRNAMLSSTRALRSPLSKRVAKDPKLPVYDYVATASGADSPTRALGIQPNATEPSDDKAFDGKIEENGGEG